MLSGVGIICFTACYAIALGLEITRFFFRSTVRSAVISAFTVAGLVAHSAFIYHQQIAIHDGRLLGNFQGFFFILAWGLIALYIYLMFNLPKSPFGLVLLPLSLALIIAGYFFADSSRFAPESGISFISFWRTAHGISFIGASFSVFAGFVFGLTYFQQERRLKKKSPPFLNIRLPSLEWLSNAAFRSIGVSLLMLAVGIFTGILINGLSIKGARPGVSPFDPMIIGTISMFLFLLVFFLLLAFRPPGREGRRIAALTLAAFLFLVFILIFGAWFRGRHWQSASYGNPNNASIISASGRPDSGGGLRC